jgi:hypothetical protein
MVLSISSHSGRLNNIYYNTNLLTVDGCNC